MIDVTLLREDPEKVKASVAAKQKDPAIVDQALKADEQWREILGKVENLRAEKNKLSKDHNEENIKAAKAIKEDLKTAEADLAKTEEEYFATLDKIPNLIAPDVPEGKDESENKVIRKWGEPTKFDFEPKDHMELGEALGLINTKKAAEIAGSRFGYLMGDAALLEFALVQFAFSVLTDSEKLKSVAEKVGEGYSNKAFVPVVPPVFIKPDVFGKMARLEPQDERYYIKSDDQFLIGSAEHTLGPLHMNETLPEKSFPLRYVGFSTAFRREAGTYGKDTRGILRVHQFDKLEMESFTLPENSLKEQDFFVAIQEYLMQQLELPYQVVAICTGDMGAPDFRQIDINTWLPGQNKYRETHTSDLMTDYQARRLNTRVQRKGGSEFVHMNDATAFAIGRTIIAILENYQQSDGTIRVPEVLQKWMGKEVIGK